MKALNVGVDAKDVAEHRAGDSTLKVVRAFQEARKIPFDEEFLVDGPTAAAMNKLLTNCRSAIRPSNAALYWNVLRRGSNWIV